VPGSSRLPLGVRAEAARDGQQVEILRALEAYDLTPVRERILAGGLMPRSWVDEAIYEFRRYLGLVALSSQPVPMTSKAVDDVWHTCLLFTQLYADLCASTVGWFVHHEPADERHALSDSDRLDFRAAYEWLYGPPGRLWPIHGERDR
jgi:hypothetical protein